MDTQTKVASRPERSAKLIYAVILLGSPGAGKGTQSRRISKILQIPQISSGDILRKNIRSGSGLGNRVKELVERGTLIPDSLVCEVIFRRLAKPDCKNGFILDGFPRTRAQAESFDSYLAARDRVSMKRSIQTIVVHLVVSRFVLLKRISGRRICVSCGAVYNIHSQPPRVADVCDADGSPLKTREDDRDETILERLAIDREQASALKLHYAGLGSVLEIDGDRPADMVTAEVQDLIGKVMRTAETAI